MIDPSYVRTMAAYNAWQNRCVFAAADRLGDPQRRADLGAFFGSIHGTLNHLLWGDRIWLHRFAGTPAPSGGIATSAALHESWDELRAERNRADEALTRWAGELSAADLAGDLSWRSQAAGREISRPKQLLLVHLFNHQTHHRGQVHALLTRCGARTEDTDLAFMPDAPPSR